MKLQLSLHALRLSNVAGTFKGKSDPFAVISLLDNERDSQPIILGKTEVIKNNLNPDWTRVFIFNYDFGKPLRIVVNIFDHVRKGDNKPMGSAIFEVGSILGSKGNTKAQKLKVGGVIYVRVEKSVGKGLLNFRLIAESLKNVERGFFQGKSDPFFELARNDLGIQGTEWNTVYRSQVIYNSLNPHWREDSIELSVLCGDNLNLPILCSVWNHEKNGKHSPLGQFQTTVKGLITNVFPSSFNLVNIKKKKTVGKIIVQKAELVNHSPKFLQETSTTCNVIEDINSPHDHQGLPESTTNRFRPSDYTLRNTPSEPEFIDYIHGGCEINLCVGIDFTGSNGNPLIPGSLHYQYPDGSKNDYEKVISAVGSILTHYDTDKKIPVWGFGAKYGGVVRHCFQCGCKSEVHATDGILKAYRQTFQSGLIMSGPTDITEILRMAAACSKSRQEEAKSKGKQAYTILLILTDGVISDITSTSQIILSICDAPLSVVIVGIGNANFDSMKFLDDLGIAHNSNDIVQFVEFNAHRHDINSLTAETLDEIPKQLVRYFTRHNIPPLPRVAVIDEEVVVEPVEKEIDLPFRFWGGKGF